jgi:hypothetical protein
MSCERFNTANCDMLTRAIFDDNLTVTAIRIVKLLFIIESKVYNCRNIATMVGMTVWPTHKALKLLVKYGYLAEKYGDYTLNLPSVLVPKESVLEKEQVVLKKEQPVLKKEQPVLEREHLVLEKEPNNIKQIIKNNNTKTNNIIYPPWVDEECSALLDEWLANRKKMRKLVSQSIVNHNLKPFKTSEALKPALEATVGNGWIGIPRDYNQNRNLTPKPSLQQGYKLSQNFINGLHNQAVVKMYEEMEEREEQQKLEKQKTLEINYDNKKANVEVVNGILSTIPQLNPKTGYRR